MTLALYDAACRALDVAQRVDEVKDIRDKAQALAAYAKQANDTQLLGWATRVKVRAERRAGEIMQEMEKNLGGNPNWLHDVTGSPPTLSSLGISKIQSSRWQKIAALTVDVFEQALAEAEGQVTTAALLRLGGNHRAQGTGENEWYTPGRYVDAVRSFLGEIDLDPASSEQAQAVIRAGKYYTRAQDGLSHFWAGRVFLNPPYTQPDIELFMAKLVVEFQAKRVTEAIALTHNYTDTTWFQTTAQACAAICFTRGRIAFVSPAGVRAAPTQGQAFFYFGHRVAEFAGQFASIGVVVEPVSLKDPG